MPPDPATARLEFRRLHERGCFLMPNAWDAGSARLLASLGFPALASTSAGLAFSRGLPDGAVPLEEVLRHLGDLVGATALPVNADLEAGFGRDPAGVAGSVRRAVAAGVAGLSIEDATGRPEAPLYALPEALERLRAARAAIDAAGGGVLLTARAECHLTGHADPLRESLRRLEAYADAGADCLYAPGLPDLGAVAAVVRAVAPRPVNVLVSAPGFTLRALEDLGVRRVSVGAALARAAWGAFMRAAREMAQRGTFDGLGGAATFGELNGLFGEAWRARGGPGR